MLKLILATLGLASFLLLSAINRPSPHDVLHSAEFPESNTSNKVNISELPALRPGAPLYHALSRRPFAIVAGTDSAHEFADGTIARAVLVEFKDGTQFWLSHAHLNCLLTDKAEVGPHKSCAHLKTNF